MPTSELLTLRRALISMSQALPPHPYIIDEQFETASLNGLIRRIKELLPDFPFEESKKEYFCSGEMCSTLQGIAEYLSSTNEFPAQPIWRTRPLRRDSTLCFMLMPFSSDTSVQEVYQHHIAKVVRDCHLVLKRADDIFSNREIVEDIWACLCSARLVIADVTGRNPNVFYELGITHTVGTDAIIVTQNNADVPFDLRHLRFIRYEYTPPGMQAFEECLEETIRSVIKAGA